MTRNGSTVDARFLLIREHDQNAPNREETETATFAFGRLWESEAQFGNSGFERVSLHRLGQDQAACIEFTERAVLPKFS